MGLSARYPHAPARTRFPEILSTCPITLRQMSNRAVRDSRDSTGTAFQGVSVPDVSQRFLGKPNEQGQRDSVSPYYFLWCSICWLPDSPITCA
jgi:hypothetical protein